MAAIFGNVFLGLPWAALLSVLALLPRNADSIEQEEGFPAELVPLAELPLRTQGRYVVGRSKKRVKLACVNYYGASQRQMVQNGLDHQPLDDTAARIVQLGFNCIRLPFSLDMLLRNMSVPHPELTLAANPALQGLSPLQIFDKTVSALTKVGLLVILNNHVSSAGWCCSDSDGEGLWYTDKYSEDDWLEGLKLITHRYRSDVRVAGFDLRNEVRQSGLVLPTWGSGDPKTDWAIAAVKGAKAVLAENPNLLIVVSGIHFGMRLSEVPNRPIHEQEPLLVNRTMYTTHFYYGWSFDMVAYDMIGRNIPYLMGFLIWFVTLLAVDGWRTHMLPQTPSPEGEVQLMPLVEGCVNCPDLVQHDCSEFQTDATGRWELVLVVAVLALQACFFCIGEHLGQTCGHIHIVSPPAFSVLSNVCFMILYVLWARILLAYTMVVLLWSNGSSDEQGPSYPRDFSLENSGADGNLLPDREDPGPVKRLAAKVVACCGRRAFTRLLQPVRTRKIVAALAAMAYLFTVSFVGQRCGSYTLFRGELDACLGPLLTGQGVAKAPVWLSEFGSDVKDNYFVFINKYLKERDLEFAYWSINGEKRFNESESYALLEDDNKAVRQAWKLRMIQRDRKSVV